MSAASAAAEADDRWSPVAGVWSQHWTSFLPPLWERLAAGLALGPGSRVLDIGAGSGELLAWLGAQGVTGTVGVEPAAGMRELAERIAPAGSVVLDGSWEALPADAGAFDAVTAINALQFAEDQPAALDGVARLLAPAGRIAIANWAEAPRNDLDVIERAVAAAYDEEVPPDDELRLPGGLESVLEGAEWNVLDAGVVELPWLLPSTDALVQAVLLGEDDERIAELAPVVRDAAAPFLAGDGVRLVNSFRYAIASRVNNS